jgi:chromosome segregation ATPase
MTSEEMERSIEFLLNSQASLEAKIEQTNDQVKRTSNQVERTNTQLEQTNIQLEQTNIQLEQMGKQLDIYAETQSEFMQVVLRHIEAQGEINASLRRTSNDLSVAQQNLTVAQQQTEERLNSLIETVDRYISERRDGKS